MWHTGLLVVAALLLFAGIFNPPVKFNLIAAGLFCWVVSLLVP